jgi:hypothetical protein
MKWMLVFQFLFLALPAQAYLTSDWDFSAGMSTINYKYPLAGVNESIETLQAIEVNYSINKPSLNSALTLSFMEMIGGGNKQLPFTRLALGARYYLIGVNGYRVILDSTSSAKVWRPTPFISVNVGLSSLAVDALNASLLDLNLRGGVEVPAMSDLLIIGQFSLGTSLTRPSSEDVEVSYTSMNLFVGLRFVGFD